MWVRKFPKKSDQSSQRSILPGKLYSSLKWNETLFSTFFYAKYKKVKKKLGWEHCISNYGLEKGIFSNKKRVNFMVFSIFCDKIIIYENNVKFSTLICYSNIKKYLRALFHHLLLPTLFLFSPPLIRVYGQNLHFLVNILSSRILPNNQILSISNHFQHIRAPRSLLGPKT